MGFTRSRPGRDGVTRYQALYDDVKGHRRSAGTFATEKAADKAWQRAEARMAEGRMGNPSRGRQRFRTYVEDEWLPHHQMEARTRENYTYYLDRHILPWFGSMRMIEVMPADVREWITDLQNKKVSAHVIRRCMTILGAIFTTALSDVVHLHPVRGIKPPPIAKKAPTIVTPEQFDKLYLALPSGTMKLLAHARHRQRLPSRPGPAPRSRRYPARPVIDTLDLPVLRASRATPTARPPARWLSGHNAQ